jgi:hypothetical protein
MNESIEIPIQDLQFLMLAVMLGARWKFDENKLSADISKTILQHIRNPNEEAPEDIKKVIDSITKWIENNKEKPVKSKMSERHREAIDAYIAKHGASWKV